MIKGVVLYDGPSLINGEDIFVIASFYSENKKTGNMIQTWILPKNVHPIDEAKHCKDSSICGDCPFRGKWDVENQKFSNRGCYVLPYQAPTNVWHVYNRGLYPVYCDDHRLYFYKRNIRIGSYGDPTAVPLEIWEKFISLSGGHTAYTHFWRENPEYREICVASVSNEQDALEANLLGWQTFRVSVDNELLENEISCLSNCGLTCDQCAICNGSGKNVSIKYHGGKSVSRGALLAINREF